MKAAIIYTAALVVAFAAGYYLRDFTAASESGSKKLDTKEDAYVEKVLHGLYYDGIDSMRRAAVLDSLARAYRAGKH